MRDASWGPFVLFPVLFLLLCGVGLAVFVVQLTPEEQAALGTALGRHRPWLFFGALLLVGSFAGGLWWLLTQYLVPLRTLGEDTQVIFSANPQHRVSVQGAPDVQRLGAAVNAVADRFEGQQEALEQAVAEVRTALEAERTTLAAVMGEVVEGVLVCSEAGRILLYNEAARRLLEGGDASGGYVGLGRSLYGLLDRPVCDHLLAELARRQESGQPAEPAHVVTHRHDRWLRLRAASVQAATDTTAGFVLVVYDITDRLEETARREAAVQRLTEQQRAHVAGLRAAIEALRTYPDLDAEHRERFEAAIEEAALALSEQIDALAVSETPGGSTAWLLEPMLGTDLLQALRRTVTTHLDVDVAIERQIEGPTWVEADGYLVVHALRGLMERVQQATGAEAFTFRTRRRDRFVELDVVWDGPPISGERLRAWRAEPVADGAGVLPLTLDDVIDLHGAEVWSRADPGGETAHLRLLLPETQRRPTPHERPGQPLRSSRPIVYDFDLLGTVAPDSSLADRPLTELTYTVFDTETTGLDPTGGDEIISVGAVRIVNGRVLEQETFDQLVDPRRPLSLPSIRVHGIQPEMLQGQPTIDQVLPRFHRFAEDTVLVAHNAAFDLRFLQVKEAAAGVRFDQPVLDTLLLAAVAQPTLRTLSLDALAERFAITITGRHSALGDALATAALLLRLLPLLEAQGIRTLAEAQAAAQRTALAKLEY